jgi:alpha-tubulin suppressor-like RCC1 family protein
MLIPSNQASAPFGPLNLNAYIPPGVGTPIKVCTSNSGGNHVILITSTGNVLVWGGTNSYGEHGRGVSGTGATLIASTYENIKTVSGYDSTFLNEFFIEAACGISHTLLLAQSGNLYACGRSQFGQVGNGTNSDSINRFVLIGTGFAKIAAGGLHSAAIKNNGDLYCWGNNIFGQLGLGAGAPNANIPTLVASLSNVQQISCGFYHTIAIR